MTRSAARDATAASCRWGLRTSPRPATIPPMGKAPGAVVLLWGEDDFLLREAALELLGDLRPTEVDAAEWQGGELQDLATPSCSESAARCS